MVWKWDGNSTNLKEAMKMDLINIVMLKGYNSWRKEQIWDQKNGLFEGTIMSFHFPLILAEKVVTVNAR